MNRSDYQTCTVDASEAYERMNTLPGDTISLADVLDTAHDAECICDECTRLLGNKLAKDFIFRIYHDGGVTFRFHIDPFVAELKKQGFHELVSYDVNTARYSHFRTHQDYTVVRFECADTYED